MNKPYLPLMLMLTLLLFGCGTTPRRRSHFVCVVDLTKSVEADSKAQGIEALSSALGKLRRGDSLTIIPITGDALTETQGHILRFNLSEEREAYDADIRRVGGQIQEDLRAMSGRTEITSYNSSDLLGAFELAKEEFSTVQDSDDAKAVRHVLVVLTDFIQDDALYNFKRETKLSDEQSSKDFAESIAQQRTQNFDGVIVYLGMLRSSDMKRLTPVRRAAIRSFWVAYFNSQGAASVNFVIDGPGQLGRFLEQPRRSSSAD